LCIRNNPEEQTALAGWNHEKGGKLPAALRGLPLRVDLARHVHRPGTRGPAAGQNFLYDPAWASIRPLTDSELFRLLRHAGR
jgi:hypothetical protein